MIAPPANGACPACGTEIAAFLTQHGCCAITLMRIADAASYLNPSSSVENRDDASFPSNIMAAAFNSKCATLTQFISNYCTAVKLAFLVTLRNIDYAYYALNAAAFHLLLIKDIAQYLGMVQDDVSIVTNGNAVQGIGGSSFATMSTYVTQDATAGVAINVDLRPANNDVAATSSADLSAALSSGTLPLNNAASNVAYLINPTTLVTAQSSASSVAASFLLLVVLAFFAL
jgi:hypothetical protein